MRRPRHLVRWLVLAGVIVVVAGIIYYRRWRPTEVNAQAVARGWAVEAVYATGTVEPLRKVVVKARIAEGFRFIGYSLDITMLTTACTEGLAAIRPDPA